MNPSDPIKTNQLMPGYWHATVGDYDLGDPIGKGETEAEAVADLREQLSYKCDLGLEHIYLEGCCTRCGFDSR